MRASLLGSRWWVWLCPEEGSHVCGEGAGLESVCSMPASSLTSLPLSVWRLLQL